MTTVPWQSWAQLVAASSASETVLIGMAVAMPAARAASAVSCGERERSVAMGTVHAQLTKGAISRKTSTMALSWQKPQTRAMRLRMCIDLRDSRRALSASGLCPPSKKTGGSLERSWQRAGQSTVRRASVKAFGGTTMPCSARASKVTNAVAALMTW